MAKIPFDIKYRPQIESGEYKVETRDGRRARIICWDKIDDNHPIIALVPFHGMEESIDYTNKGQYFREGEMTEDDLFIVTPEEEINEIEKRLVKFYNDRNCLPHEKDGVYNQHDLDELLHNTAAELLSLAIDARAKELSKGLKQSKLDKDSIPYHLIEFMCNLYTCQNWKEIEETAELYATRIKAAAMKDLPRWTDDGLLPKGSELIELGGLYGFDFIRRHGKLLRISDIEKLPGFKEDGHE